MKTPEQVWKMFKHLDEPQFTREVNLYFREQDESHLWPINGRFNATERAIRKARQYRRDTGSGYWLEYIYLLDSLIEEIVNEEV